MTLKEAEVVALSTLKQVMEEKVSSTVTGHQLAVTVEAVLAPTLHVLQGWKSNVAWIRGLQMLVCIGRQQELLSFLAGPCLKTMA